MQWLLLGRRQLNSYLLSVRNIFPPNGNICWEEEEALKTQVFRSGEAQQSCKLHRLLSKVINQKMISRKGRLFGGNAYEIGREIQACSFCGLSPVLGWALGWHSCILPTHVPENRPCLGFCKRLQETHWLTKLVFNGIVSLVCCRCSVGVNWCLFTLLAECLP